MSDAERALNGGGGGDASAKTEKEKARMAKRQAKLEKFEHKQRAAQARTADKRRPKERAVVQVVTYDVPTALGEKKDVARPLPDAYSPRYVEAAWYAWWEKSGFFKPEYQSDGVALSQDGEREGRGKFVMVIPPPNVTGTLHIGHALTNAIQDCLARWHRMSGRVTLWNPGCDHAGIATQVVVEKKLWRETGKTRHDLGREEFVKKVTEWKDEKMNIIYNQLKALGSSLDWDRACFTMDQKMCDAVTEAFVRLHEDGTIYRSARFVNWSCCLKSAISDIEVEKLELTGRTLLSVPGYKQKVEFGVLVLFAYPLEHSDTKIVVATTRLETMLGDVAIAVHPDDDRYKLLHGRNCVHPFLDRRLPIVADSFVDMSFGTGAVKITPAHDPTDYEVATRHRLPYVVCINDDGTMSSNCGVFSNLKRFDARSDIMTALKRLGLFVGIESNPMVLPVCSRSGDIVEPRIKTQWFVKCDEMAKDAMELVKSGQLKITPECHVKTWNTWMENIRDWCISRQLWWGHRIPAYFVKIATDKHHDMADERYWVSARSYDEAVAKAIKRFSVPKETIVLSQDEDVLDTWFSSAIFPFSIFGWPNKTADLERFYPGTLLETGYDILFFWVARMVFLGRKLTGQLPFETVYLHSVVRDAHGRKMSKSLGNVIDPLDVIRGITLEELHDLLKRSNLDSNEVERAKEGQRRDYPNGIPECGTDALRFALCSYTGQGKDINLNVLRVQGYRFFCNKIWNACRFTLAALGGADQFQVDAEFATQLGSIDRWILSRLTAAVRGCNEGFQNYDLSKATSTCYSFWLYELCDVYLEYVKRVLRDGGSQQRADAGRQVLRFCVETALKLISPFMPFLSEELWQRLPVDETRRRRPASICVASYPDASQFAWADDDLDGRVQFILDVVKCVRSLRADYGLTAKMQTKLYLTTVDDQVRKVLSEFAELVEVLACCSSVQVGDVPSAGCATFPVSNKCKVHLLLEGIVDREKEAQKLSGRADAVRDQLGRLSASMATADYATKVPEDVRATNEDKARSLRDELEHISDALRALQSM